MKIKEKGHLSYCTNIHAAETWEETFEALQKYIPKVKQECAPDKSFGIGLRLSAKAAATLLNDDHLQVFKTWMLAQDVYVYTINGFPYGQFHQTIVKDKVYAPDWTTEDRLAYTLQLVDILLALLPEEVEEGSISTCPIAYRYNYPEQQALTQAKENAAIHFLRVAEYCHQAYKATGKKIHIDIEPEPDGILENTSEIIHFFNEYLLPKASVAFRPWVKDYIRVCYDVCHFALVFEEPEKVLTLLEMEEIKVGKIQLSAALGAVIRRQEEFSSVLDQLRAYREDTYLHQVRVQGPTGKVLAFKDLPEVLTEERSVMPIPQEWRIHYHVPLFFENKGLLQSTQQEVITVLQLWLEEPFCSHLEVETYTWSVLPDDMKISLETSIAKEIQWVLEHVELQKIDSYE
ncbi:metabolite traffic protein EboE [Algivirga pacifica]|uniref:Metabolite traffic protein EboE n=1 Tax=Algivirga pacifica TaxID=1162670 RepID=A0ABP9D9A9_9BACT